MIKYPCCGKCEHIKDKSTSIFMPRNYVCYAIAETPQDHFTGMSVYYRKSAKDCEWYKEVSDV